MTNRLDELINFCTPLAIRAVKNGVQESARVAYQHACKAAVADLRTCVDNGWVFINYRRRGDATSGHPVGAAVAFYYKEQLYVGASACMLAPVPIPKQVRQEAARLLLEVGQEFALPVAELVEAVQAMRPSAVGCDPWSRHIGIWKAVTAARPLDKSIAADVAKVSNELFEAARSDKSVRLFKLPNLMQRVAADPRLASFRSWLDSSVVHADGTASRMIPWRTRGTVISVIRNAVREQAKLDAEKQTAVAGCAKVE